MTRLSAAWIACLAMLFAALAPSVSQAMSAAPGNTWTEICSIGGSKFVKVASDAGDLSHHTKSNGRHVEHCPLCATDTGSLALTPSAGFSIPLETQETHPFLFFQSPRPLAIWTVAQSRAPPFHS